MSRECGYESGGGCGAGGGCGCGCASGPSLFKSCREGLPHTENRPGLDALVLGARKYGYAYVRMLSKLSRDDLTGLAALTARAADGPLDASIALLDGWACLSEILGFYLERAVNESYLRTCTERSSAVALANLVGYAPRPGVAADAWLAFTLDDLDPEATLAISTGTRAYSLPGVGETMQPFETVEPLIGRPRWSRLRPRMNRPQRLVPEPPPARAPQGNDADGPEPQVLGSGAAVWFTGITTGLRPGDLVLFEFGRGRKLGSVALVVEPVAGGTEPGSHLGDPGRTRVALMGDPAPAPRPARPGIGSTTVERLAAAPGNLTTSRERLELLPDQLFPAGSPRIVASGAAAMLAAARPELRESLADAVGGAAGPSGPGRVKAFGMQVKAAAHGHNAPLPLPIPGDDGRVVAVVENWNFDGTPRVIRKPDPQSDNTAFQTEEKEEKDPDLREIALDAEYDGILPGSLVAILIRPAMVTTKHVYTVQRLRSETRTGFGMPARVTVLTLDRAWRTGKEPFSALRSTVVFARNEALELAERPLASDVEGERLELDSYYPGLEPPRRFIVSGERTDIPGVTGVHGSELVMVAGVTHGTLPDTTTSTSDAVHTSLVLAPPGLRYTYRRSTVAIYGNVAHATHGESRTEVLGDGDASRRLQEFALKQTPLTYVPAPTPSGVASTLEVRVNDLRWQEAKSPAVITPDDRAYVLRTADPSQTTVVTGFGVRPATGQGNIRARYRSGLGGVGNLKPGQISVLASQPNGVTGVSNPIASTGGADRDELDQIRKRTPIGLAALDRIVSASDLEDFAKAFAGIGKARTWLEPGIGRPPVRVLTIAGEGDVPIGESSALLRNLTAAVAIAGDLESAGPGELITRTAPETSISIRIRDAALITLRARVRLLPDYSWEVVFPRITAALLSRLGFNARDLGERLDPGVAIAAMQRVRGVAAVDLQAFGSVDAAAGLGRDALATIGDRARSVLNAQGAPAAENVAPGRIAYLVPEVTGTLLLSEWGGN